MPDLSVEIAGIWMKNPVMNACGTFDITVPGIMELTEADKIGAYVEKTTTLYPREGNPQPRTYETPAGMINRIGLQNFGIWKLIEEKLPIICELLPADIPLIISIAGESIEEYLELTTILAENTKGKVAGIEVNVSCPNVKDGLVFGTEPNLLFKLVTGIKLKAVNLPVIVKLTPNVTDIGKMAKVVEKAGADAVSLINTLRAMAHIRRGPSAGQWIKGGLSGRAIQPAALYLVREVVENVKIPVIGMGGIFNTESALDFLLIGASAVAVGTETFPNPRAMAEIVDGLDQYLREKNYSSIAELRQKEGLL